MAFSIAGMSDFSQGLMVMSRGSGTFSVATWLSGVIVP